MEYNWIKSRNRPVVCYYWLKYQLERKIQIRELENHSQDNGLFLEYLGKLEKYLDSLEISNAKDAFL